ncbi:hypothetical protein [Paenibacillus agaridevorans]|uniref:hypothetical protein n=1 Tax=Paenibacillus agaridevorans TaxID=171404 RepID=UPI002484AAC8|nr:hypothetical protein [Paenibacillus agaridevorans]
MHLLQAGTNRFNELKRNMPGITESLPLIYEKSRLDLHPGGSAKRCYLPFTCFSSIALPSPA